MKEISIRDVIDAYKPGVGRHWFDDDTMRCFGTRLSGSAFKGAGGTYFVTSDKHPAGNGRWVRRWSVRQFVGVGEIETLGEFGGYRNGASAKRAAIRAAKGGAR